MKKERAISVYLSAVLVLAFIFFIITGLFVSNYRILGVSGNSMAPTLHDREFAILKRQTIINHEDIVLFRAPTSWEDGGVEYVKRIVGLPGDRLDISSDGIAVNGTVVRKPTKNRSSCSSSSVLLGDRQYFVVGDNIDNSNDSYYQFCEGNEEFLITNDNITSTGVITKIIRE